MRLVGARIAAMALLNAASAAAQSNPEPADVVQQASDTEAGEKIVVIQDHVDAYRARDLDRFIATFAPDAEVYANGLVAVGRAEIRALYRLNCAPNAPTIRVYESGSAGEFIYLSIAFVLSSGEELCCTYSEYEVVDGKITYLAASG